MSKGSVSRRLTQIAVLIPVLGLVALIGRAEFAVRQGPTWAIPITGYDPRDLLHGHYLQYQYRFDWQGRDSCGSNVEPGREQQRELMPTCCLCLTRDRPDGFDPAVRQTRCEEAQTICDGALRSQDVMPPLRYYVPEERALELEQALRTHEAALELGIGPDGRPAIRELLLDGRPWRDVLGD